MKSVLVFCPTYEIGGVLQIRKETRASIKALAAPDGVKVKKVIGNDNPHEVGSAKNILHQYQVARKMALDGGYDALMTIEHDMIVPADALVKLAAVPDAGVVYGVYMLRHGAHVLNAFQDIPKSPAVGTSLTMYPVLLAKARKAVIYPVSGCGMGCTLIHRYVLERFEFRATDGDSYPPDWGLAQDCKRGGVPQKARFDVVCGHFDDSGLLIPFTHEGGHEVVIIPTCTMWVNVGGSSVRMIKDQPIKITPEDAVELERAGYVRVER